MQVLIYCVPVEMATVSRSLAHEMQEYSCYLASSVKSSEVICPTNLSYADMEPEHIMLQSDSTETWRPGWCLLTNTHEQTAAGTQSEWLHDRFVKSQEKEYWVRVTEIDIFSRSPPQTPSDSLLSAMGKFLSLCPSLHSVEGGFEMGST